MALLSAVLATVSGVSFLFYGYETLCKVPPRGEFERYGMANLRRFVGSMQVLGGAGVIAGLAFRPLGVAAAAGLTTMMVLGLVVRYRIHDAPRLMVPAATLGLLNGALVVVFLLG